MSMKSFALYNPKTLGEAIRLLDSKDVFHQKTKILAGGQDLLTEMKEHIIEPESVINLKHIPGLNYIKYDPKTGLKIGALTHLSEIAENRSIRQLFPALAVAAESVGSAQIRNMGTLGGNLCQRPRCWYYRNEHLVCLKKGGSNCLAASGENKYNAILGGGPSFIVHPSDTATALVALGARLTIVGAKGTRTIPLSEFFVLPRDNPRNENILQANEIVTEISVPNSPRNARSVYFKFREQVSMDWALSAVAVALELKGGVVQDCRIVLGGVAPIPWRVPEAEALLKGKTPSAEILQQIAEKALEGAIPLNQNGYKVALTKALVRRAVRYLTESATPPSYRDVNRL